MYVCACCAPLSTLLLAIRLQTLGPTFFGPNCIAEGALCTLQSCAFEPRLYNFQCVACRLLLCNTLLLHTTLPLPSLILLIQLLDMLQLQQPESGAVTQTQGTLIGVTSTLAEVLSAQLFPATCWHDAYLFFSAC